MTELAQFLLPDLGEGLEEAQLVQWLVQAGDRVTLNQPICQVETAKALVDVPSPFAGIVEQLHAQPGDTVLVGRELVTFSADGADGGARQSVAASGGSADGRGPVLVGYGVEGPAQTFSRRRRGATGAEASAASSPTQDGVGRASPLVRKIAEERGIDLTSIKGSGAGGRIRVEDLEAVPISPVRQRYPRHRVSRRLRMRNASAPLAYARPSPRVC